MISEIIEKWIKGILIDGIMNQQNRSKGVQIVESVVDMAHRLNLPIIAEGVETPE